MRRPYPRMNRGRVASVVSATPATIFGSNILQWCRSDLGITIGTGVSAWADQSNQAQNYVQGTGAAQPTYTAVDATINNRPSLTFDGADDELVCSTLNLPAPATTPTWVWLYMKNIAWVALDRIIGAETTATGHILYQNDLTPEISQFNASKQNDNNQLAVGTWGAVQGYFSASAADFVAINDSAPVTGVSCGNNTSTGRKIGNDNTSVRWSNIAVCEIIYAKVLPSSGQLAALAAYRRAIYGS